VENCKSEKHKYRAMVIKNVVNYSVIFSALFFIFICSCSEKKTDKKEDHIDDKAVVPGTEILKDTNQTRVSLQSFYEDNRFISLKVDSIFNSLSEEERVGQIIIASSGELGKPKEEIAKLISEKKIGGVVILKGNSNNLKEQINYLREQSINSGSLPLLFSCDAEPTLFNSKLRGSPQVINTSSIKTNKDCGAVASTISGFIKGLGFNQNYAPVCDFDINKDIIGERSFGHDEKKVSNLASEFIKVSQNSGIVATGKHFPGHGTVKGDSHNSLVFIDGKLQELEVFSNTIKAGVISIMVGHIAIRNNEEYETDGLPSTLSPRIVTYLLKKKLGFKGLVITDAMNMGAVTGFKTPSLNAVKAGCDLILMPTNESLLHQSIMDQIMSDEAFKSQVHESVKKIIRLKVCLGLI
jgi:beta-N-acetylhexosaminidase